jgi:hypothetical protein
LVDPKLMPVSLVERLLLTPMEDGLPMEVVPSLEKIQARSTDLLLTMQDMLLNQLLQTILLTEF